MLTGFRAIIAQFVNVIKPHHVLVFFLVLFLGQTAYLRIHILSVLVLDFQKPCHMVDTGNQLTADRSMTFRNAEIVK